MSGLLKTLAALPGAMPLPAITDAERAVAGYAPIMWFSAREAPPEARGTVIRDRIRGLSWTGQGGAYYSGGGGAGDPPRPVIRFGGGTSAYMTAPFQLPASYGVFVLGRLNGFVSPGSTFLGSRFGASSGSAAGQRMYLNADTSGRIELAHGSTAIDTPVGSHVVLNQDFACWAGFDASDLSAAVALNSVAAQTTGTLGGLQKAQSQSAIGGVENAADQTVATGTFTTNGWIEEMIVFAAPVHRAAYADLRAAVMGYFADRAGIALVG